MFNSVKVFSATMWQDRDKLGDKVTEWIAVHPGINVVDVVVTQSSDREFHCIAITVFYIASGNRSFKDPTHRKFLVTRSGYDPKLGRDHPDNHDPTLPPGLPRRLKFKNGDGATTGWETPTMTRTQVDK